MLPESRQRLGYGRLADPEGIGGRRHRAEPGDQDERVELSERHDLS
jgi:hypothetical protein